VKTTPKTLNATQYQEVVQKNDKLMTKVKSKANTVDVISKKKKKNSNIMPAARPKGEGGLLCWLLRLYHPTTTTTVAVQCRMFYN